MKFRSATATKLRPCNASYILLSYHHISIPIIIFPKHSFCSNITATNTATLHLHSSSQCFSLLRNAISTANLLLGKSTHALIISSSHITTNDRRFLTNNLITMYSKCGSLSSARHLFDKMPQRDLVTWNSILAAYATSRDTHNNIQEGFRLFRLLLSSSPFSPTKLTLAPVLKLCLMSGHICASEGVHAYSSKIGLDSNLFVSAALVNIYCKFGRVRGARFLFDDITESDRDAVLWNVMLKAYVQLSFNEETFTLLSEFYRAGLHLDMISLPSVLSGFAKVDFEEGTNYVEQLQAYATKSKLLQYDDNSDNVIMWNKTLSQYHQSGENRVAIECFIAMNILNVRCDNVTFIVALASVTAITNLELGKQIHCMSLKSGLDLNVIVGNSLINMYSKAGCLTSARKVFTYMEEVDLISWNSIITCCAQSGLEEDSVALFKGLLLCDGLRPDHFTFAGVLRPCSSLCLSKQIHVYALKTGIITDSFVSTALIDVYSKNGRTKEAEFFFKNKDRFDLASWNAMMYGYITCNDSQKALELFSLMHKRGEIFDDITLATIAKACGSLVGLKQGKQLHGHVVKVGADTDLFISSGILDMYIKCGEMLDAERVFERISVPDDVAWTAMISGCVENGDEDRALIIYHQMRQSGILPDEFTFSALIKAASCLTALEQGKQIHANVIKSDCGSDTFVCTALIDMYAKCGELGDSYRLFNNGKYVKNVAVWNAILVGLAQHGHGEEAVKLFKKMEFHGVKPDRVTFIGVLSACSHSGLVSDVYEYFHVMLKDYGIKPEIEHYSCLVDALGRSGRVQEAEELITTMPFEASSSMYRALLGACRVQGDAEMGKRVAARLLALEPADSSAYVLLSNIYAATNRWDEVNYARKMMKRNNVKKDPGFSWIDVKNVVHLFVVDDRSHPQAQMIYDKIEDLIRMIKEDGYIPDTDYVLLDVEEEERERSLYYHSEKLAIAFGLFSTPMFTTIRVIKNLRVCGDCHNAIKHISKVCEREIVLRDANRFHRFKGGICSCADYW